MSVVLRCPNCGTTRATPGECEACQEGPVRYFCTNHAPGLWLSGRACPTCGAAFGEPARAITAGPMPSRTRAPKAMRAPRSAPALPLSPVSLPARRARDPGAELGLGYDEGLEPSSPAMAPWQKILSAVLRARSAAISARDPHPPVARFGGCLGRLLVTVVILLITAGVALFLFGRALLQSLQP
jgi:hypothetical protein